MKTYFETKFKETEIGKIPKDWEVKELNYYLDKITYGFTCPMPTTIDGPYMITAKDLKGNKLNLNSARKTSLIAYNDNLTDKSKPKLNDLLLSKDGTLGRIAIVGNEKICISQSVALLRFNKLVEINFMKYLLISSKYQRKMINDSDGTTIKHIYITRVNKMEVTIPSIQEQKAIAKILSDLDEKIEINRKINENLEELGQTLFREWFIDFEFPNKKGKPYKSSGGEMVESELGEIPKGWKVENLDKLIIRNNKSIKEYKNWKNKKLIDLSNMPKFSMSIIRFEKGEKFKSNIYELNEFDILYGSIRPYFGKYGFSPINGVITGTIHSLKPKDNNYYSFILNIICRKKFVNYTIKYSKGTKMPIIGWNDFKNFKFPSPLNKELLIKFNNLILPSILKIKNNILDIQSLQQIRDSLLPKLMSGQIRVNYLNK